MTQKKNEWYRGGGGLCGGNFSLWDIWRFKFAQNFPHDFKAVCEVNPLQNLAKCLVQQLPEHLETGYGGARGSRGRVR